jgi:hypothetical protein
MRYAFGTALIVAVLVGSAAPALATTLTATCDGWHVVLDGYDADATKTVSISINGVQIVENGHFQNGFNLSGDWLDYRDTHWINISVWLNGGLVTSWGKFASGCPISAPTTTPPTTAPVPTTTPPTTKAPAPATTQPTPATTVAETPATTTTAPTLSTTTTLGTTALAPTTTVDVDTTEPEASDTTVVAAADTESPSGSNTASLLIGLLAGLVLAGVGGGAWYFGRRSTQN